MPPLRLPAIGQKGLLCKGLAVRLVNFPRDGHASGVCATGSDVFPPRSSGAARSGIDEAMGPL